MQKPHASMANRPAIENLRSFLSRRLCALKYFLIFAVVFSLAANTGILRILSTIAVDPAYDDYKHHGPPQFLPSRVMRPMAQRAMDPSQPIERDTVVVTYALQYEKSKGEPCKCELVSIDCLDSIRCMPETISPWANYFIALGVRTRQVLLETTKFKGEDGSHSVHPIGKGIQYNAIYAYKKWMADRTMPYKSYPIPHIFVNESQYEYCQDHDIKGRSCFIANVNVNETLEDLEQQALHQNRLAINFTVIDHDLRNTRRQKQEFSTPSLGALLLFAHICRMRFHRTPPMIQAYQQHLQTIVHDTASTTIRVALHMRRADSCSPHLRYQSMASPLDSKAQFSGVRMCYNTKVYMDTLKRIEQLSNKILDVYLATDDGRSVLKEIQLNYPRLYERWNWHTLNYSREYFRYEGMIEFKGNKHKGFLGETAISDLWHLSHGQIFVGHLGSRFGKVSYLLSTARHGTFVPYFTVDGHSLCCEIDEPCGAMKPYIDSMQACLTFTHDEFTSDLNKDYWEVGSLIRKIIYEKRLGMVEEGNKETVAEYEMKKVSRKKKQKLDQILKVWKREPKKNLLQKTTDTIFNVWKDGPKQEHPREIPLYQSKIGPRN